VVRNSPAVIARNEAERSDEAISNLRLPRSFQSLAMTEWLTLAKKLRTTRLTYWSKLMKNFLFPLKRDC